MVSLKIRTSMNIQVKIRKVVIPFAIFLIVLPIFLFGLDQEIFAWDESLHVSRGIKGVNLLVHGVIGGDEWKFYITNEGKVQKGIITLANIIMGVGPWLNGVKSGGWIGNVEPPRYILFSSRAMVAVLGAITCVVMYYLGRELGGFMTGLIASFILAFNPLWLLMSRLALRDMPSAFFSTTSILFFFCSIKRKKFNAKVSFLTISGITMGLALGSKPLAGVAFLTIAVYLLMILTINDYRIFRTKSLSKNGREALICLLIFIPLSILFYFASLPSLWKDPKSMLQMIPGIIHQGTSTFKEKQEIAHVVHFNVPRDMLAAATGILNFVLWPLFKPTPLVHFPTCLTWFGRFLNCYNTLPALFFFFAGITYFTLIWTKKKLSKIEILTLMWFTITIAGLSWWIPVFWHRYCLQLIPPTVLIETMGLNYLLQGISKKMKYFFAGVALIIHAGFTITGLPRVSWYSLQGLFKNNIGLILTIIFVLSMFFIIIPKIRLILGRDIPSQHQRNIGKEYYENK